ncbi:unnamed protein product [Symbiodinium natans]|uniref:PKD/REJ-like domain-containing protein n=1 Tax=Symbiodinium natans TaxID=878477 RepID=A0A812HVP6_9DINO|nr:unnamed protein product [Symbiodinium natans]
MRPGFAPGFQGIDWQMMLPVPKSSMLTCTLPWDPQKPAVGRRSATATLLLGENVTTGENTLVPAGNIAFTPTPPLSSPLFTKQLFVNTTAGLVSSHESTRSCTLLTFTSVNLTGDAGRPYVVDWSFGPETPAAMRNSLASVLALASDQDSLVLTVSAAEFNAGVDAVFQELGEVPTLRLEVVAAVRNWLGVETVTTSNAFVRVDQAPQVVLASPASATILNSEEVEFSLQTVLLEDATCSDADRYNRIIEVDWEYTNTTTNSWVKLADVGSLVDTVASPFVINFAPFSFEANSSHSFRATAYFAGAFTSVAENTRVATFDLGVLPRLTPIAIVQGPAETAASCDFYVTAEASQDPSLAPWLTPNFRYKWSCESLGEYSAACSTLTADSPTLTVPGRTLEEGSYTFSVLVWRRDQTEADAGQASVTVTLNFFGLPPVLIATPWVNGSAVSTQVGWSVSPTAVVSGSAACTVPPLTSWTWVLVESASGRILSVIDAQGFGNQTYSELTIASFDGSQMVPGSYYEYVMMFGSSVLFRDLRNGAYSTLTTAVSAGGMSAVRGNRFLADGPPSARAENAVNVTPAEGYAVVTTFEFETVGWQDEQPTTLEYEFVDFKLDDLLALSYPWDTATAVAAIEWEDSSSPNHWAKLNGVTLRSWSPSPTASSPMALGSHVTVVRARDHLGASRATGLMGPLVSQPVGGVDPNVAVAALASASAQSNADSILNAVAAVSSVSIDGDEETKKAVVNAELDALQLAADITSAESSGLKKVGDVMASTLSKGSTTADPAIVDKAAAVLDTVLETALTPGAMSKDAGDSLLGSVAAMVTGSSAASTTVSEEQKASTTEKLIGLTSKLGQSVMNSIAVNATEVLTSIGADGKGSQVVVKKQSAQDVQQNGLNAHSISVPASALAGARRLQSSPACDTVGLQSTDWIGTNPYAWANASLGSNSEVSENATVTIVELTKCGDTINFRGSTASVSVIVPATDDPLAQLICVYFDPSSKSWTTSNVALTVVDDDGVRASCSTTQGGGAYTVFHRSANAGDSDEGGITFLTVAIALPLIILGSACAGGGIYMMHKRVHETKLKKVFPVDEEAAKVPKVPKSPSLREVVTHNPPGDPDADLPGYVNDPSPVAVPAERGKQKLQLPVPIARERDDDELSNLSNAAISELRRRSHGELAPTPGIEDPHPQMADGSGALPGQSPNPDSLYTWLAQTDSSSAHVIPVDVPARKRSVSRDPSSERHQASLGPTDWTGADTAGQSLGVPMGSQGRRPRSREPATVRVVRKADATASSSSTSSPARAVVIGSRCEARANPQPSDKQPRITVTARRPASQGRAAQVTSVRSRTPEQPAQRSQVIYAEARRRSSSAAPAASEAPSTAADRRDSMNYSQAETGSTASTALRVTARRVSSRAASTSRAPIRAVATSIPREPSCVEKLRRADEASGLQSPTHASEAGFPTLLMKGAPSLQTLQSQSVQSVDTQQSAGPTPLNRTLD